MPMQAFHELVGERAFAETRSITLLQPRRSLPAGSYGFLELHCNERGCGCRRVFLQVFREDDPRPWATIGFGWEAPSFYRAWAHGADFADDMAGSQLEPMGVQGPHAQELLLLFREVLESDPDYVARLARHHQEAQRAVARPGRRTGATGRSKGSNGAGGRAASPRSGTRRAAPSRNSPCPCGSRKRFKRCCGSKPTGRAGSAAPADGG